MPKPIGSGKKPVAPAPSPPVGAIVGSIQADFISPGSLNADHQTTEFDDVIWAYAGDDFIFASGGNDTIEAGLGNDFIDGGTGNDIINADAGNDWIIGGDGDDTINAGDGDDQIIGGNGSDTIDGGAGEYDTLTYGGSISDYDITTIYGKGKNKDVPVGYEVYNKSTGDTDTITNVEIIDFSALIFTGADTVIIEADEIAVLDVLANDVQTGYDPGEELTLTAIYDAPLLGLDLIPDEDISYFSGDDGGLLLDGSILTVDPVTYIITWQPNPEKSYEANPFIYFFYDVSGAYGEVATGYAEVQIVYPSDPVPGSVIDFDGMVDLFNGNLLFYETADTIYTLAQQTSGTGVSGTSAEYRDVLADGNYNYDTDDDLEWRVWTDPGADPDTDPDVTHELNIVRDDHETFNIATVKFTGFDDDDVVTIAYKYAPGDPNDSVVYETYVVTIADLDADGIYTFVNGTNIGQLNIIAAAGDEVFVDDIVIG